MQAPKRIIDLLLVLFFISGSSLFAGPKQLPQEGFQSVFFVTKTVNKNASISVLITQPVSRFSIVLNQTASFTFSGTKKVGNVASSPYWYVWTGSKTMDLVPQDLSSGTYLWVKNGVATQTFKFWTLGN